MEAGLYLISGGCRSGKSSQALKLARSIKGRKVFVATAQAFDQEMEERIQRHQMERQHDGWQTMECPLLDSADIKKMQDCDVLLIDCLTLWLSNQLLQKKLSDDEILNGLECLLNSCKKKSRVTLIVSNEVGMGIVPDNQLTRHYRDLLGFCHQLVAENSKECFFTIMGHLMSLKKLQELSLS